jgi:hypothetical protein
MSDQHEHDMMICRACGKPDRASEGYPCERCGTFLCLGCSFRGVVRCRKCAEAAPKTDA